MADEHAQAQDHVWEAVDPAPASPLPAPSFDEPLEWPETATFAPDNGRPVLPSDVWPDDATAPATPDGLPIQAEDQQWLAGLDLGSLDQSFAGRNGTDLDADRDLHLDPLPDSLWAADPVAETLSQPAVVVTSAQPAPTFYAEPDHRPGGRKKWLEVRHGNAAVVALISFVSLVLVGMFLSVRARNELPTDTSQSRTPTGEIAAQGPLNTIPTPTTTSATTTTAPPPVAIADLMPAAEAGGGAEGAASGGTGSGGGGTPRGGGTTAAPSRSTGPSGGSGSGSGGGGSGPATQPAATSPPPPQSTEPTSPPPTDPPVEDTTPRVTRPPRTTPPHTSLDITFPTTPTEPTPTTSVSWPSFPDIPDFDDD